MRMVEDLVVSSLLNLGCDKHKEELALIIVGFLLEESKNHNMNRYPYWLKIQGEIKKKWKN